MPKTTVTATEFPLDYDWIDRDGSPAQPWVLLLHGYQQIKDYMLRKLAPALDNLSVLAVNGVFPLPLERTDKGYSVGYSWYFYDDVNDEYFIEPAFAVQVLSALIVKLNLGARPFIIVGFSQGGYLAPFLAQAHTQCKQVIAVAARFLYEELNHPAKYDVCTIHGSEDNVVPFEETEKSWNAMLTNGAKGTIKVVDGEGHRMGPHIVAAIMAALHN